MPDTAAERPGSPPPVIAIDGPAASGKGTVARLLARSLGYSILDSGALYRILALIARRSSVACDRERDLVLLVAKIEGEIEFLPDPLEGSRPFMKGEDIGDAIRSERCSEDAARVSVHPQVRQALLGLQRSFRSYPGLVADGRDMGSVVFPDAFLKVFLEAGVDERARRRHRQLIEKGISVTIDEIKQRIVSRDTQDSTRAVAPLRPKNMAADVLSVDTTSQTAAEVADDLLEIARLRLAG
ncbi:(d)CMP kinase [Thioalkalivibrio sp. HK1]|uniref:(d)CMP kinase n=1 Tax=Thioalkalivibrio sp. HK1 TaxID=1469245 RepID=UPI0004716D62|nr:(d)CMP kinase [Thioalkalivibrio sp. HK1]